MCPRPKARSEEHTSEPQTEGNLIVNIKESRVAIGKDMANKIMV